MDQELFTKAVRAIIQKSCYSIWLREAIERGLGKSEAGQICKRANEYCKEYDTPSGHLWSALDKFVYHYVKLGYKWQFCHDDDRNTDNNIVFTRGKEAILAAAKYEKSNGHIQIVGYDIKTISN